jgi:hypothetical protein
MITMTVYVNDDGFCRIKNNLADSFYTEKIIGAINKTRKFPYEIQVPISIVSGMFPRKNEVVLYFENKELNS